MARDIWILVQHREGTIEDPTFGLVAEAQRLLSELGGEVITTAVALGSDLETELQMLGAYPADRVLYVESEALSRYQGELFADVLFGLAKKHRPFCILMSQTAETADLSSRLAALMQTSVVSRAMDFKFDGKGHAVAVRPVSNGYLFEKLILNYQTPPIVCFLPAVLSAPEPGPAAEVPITTEAMDVSPDDLKTKVVEIVEAAPEDLDLEEADIVVAGGRGVGKDEAFDIMHELAKALGGTVGGSRPVIDWQTLPYERQIGQTGKTVTSQLLVNCGISGANEYTAGIEKSQLVIAVNTDARARIFRFADLGVVGDVHEVIPLLISRLKEIKGE
jgi:electron transfer flavoprotein alpha subunit